jgi:hypothetical protein
VDNQAALMDSALQDCSVLVDSADILAEALVNQATSTSTGHSISLQVLFRIIKSKEADNELKDLDNGLKSGAKLKSIHNVEDLDALVSGHLSGGAILVAGDGSTSVSIEKALRALFKQIYFDFKLRLDGVRPNLVRMSFHYSSALSFLT